MTVGRSSDVPAALKSRVAACAAQRPERDHDERPLTDNDRGPFAGRRASSARSVRRRPHLSGSVIHRGLVRDRLLVCKHLARSCQPNANVSWRDLVLHSTPAFPHNMHVCPQREEVQLMARLSQVTPRAFIVEPPCLSDDKNKAAPHASPPPPTDDSCAVTFSKQVSERAILSAHAAH